MAESKPNFPRLAGCPVSDLCGHFGCQKDAMLREVDAMTPAPGVSKEALKEVKDDKKKEIEKDYAGCIK